MDTPATLAAPPLVPSPPRRPYLLLAITALSAALLGVGIFGFWQRYTAPSPPDINLSGADEEVVEAVMANLATVKRSPRSAENWANLAAVLRVHEFAEQADFCFREAERLAPQDPRWPYLIGVGLLETDAESAPTSLRRAVVLCGDRSAPRLQLGEVLIDRAELEEAEALFRETLDKPQADQSAEDRTLDEARAHFGLGKVALARDDVETALKHLRLAAIGAPNVKVVIATLAQTYHRKGDEMAADQELRRVAKLSNGYAWPDPWTKSVNSVWVGLRARMHRITQLDQQGYREEAVVAARQAVHRHPDSLVACLVLGETLNKARNFAASQSILEDLIRRNPNSTKTHFELGYALQMQDHGSEAVDCYRNALRLDPNFPEAHYNLALCLNGLNDKEAASEEFRSAIRLRPNYIDARLGLCMLLTQKQSYEEADEQLDEVARLEPTNRHFKELREEIRKLRGESDQNSADPNATNSKRGQPSVTE